MTSLARERNTLFFLILSVLVGLLLVMSVGAMIGVSKSPKARSLAVAVATPTPTAGVVSPDQVATVSGQVDAQIISGSFNPSQLKSEAAWRQLLTPDQYHILRESGTETPFTGALEHETRKGTYYSVGCDEPLFRSEQKYDSGTGWPSFWAPVSPGSVVLRADNSIPLEPRVEVLDKCGNHLGHVFDDGPAPTGKRYCMNSLALKFVPDANQ